MFVVLLWPLRECSHSEGFCDIATHDAHGNRVTRLSSVVLAGLADGREDFLEDPLAEGLSGLGVAPKEHLVEGRLGEHQSALLELAANRIARRTGSKIYYLTLNRPQCDEPTSSVPRLCEVLGGLGWIGETSGTGYLSRHEQKLVFRVAHEDIQLDAHEIALFKSEENFIEAEQTERNEYVEYDLYTFLGDFLIDDSQLIEKVRDESIGINIHLIAGFPESRNSLSMLNTCKIGSPLITVIQLNLILDEALPCHDASRLFTKRSNSVNYQSSLVQLTVYLLDSIKIKVSHSASIRNLDDITWLSRRLSPKRQPSAPPPRHSPPHKRHS
nr:MULTISPECIES: hypothetical protein [Pseudomonas]